MKWEMSILYHPQPSSNEKKKRSSFPPSNPINSWGIFLGLPIGLLTHLTLWAMRLSFFLCKHVPLWHEILWAPRAWPHINMKMQNYRWIYILQWLFHRYFPDDFHIRPSREITMTVTSSWYFLRSPCGMSNNSCKSIPVKDVC